MVRLRPSRAELAGALAGAGALGLAYAAGRRLGLTRTDLARTLAPGNPSAGRAAQLAIGALAALPAAPPSTPTRALAYGAAVEPGARASRPRLLRRAHALAALVAQRVAARG